MRATVALALLLNCCAAVNVEPYARLCDYANPLPFPASPPPLLIEHWQSACVIAGLSVRT